MTNEQSQIETELMVKLAAELGKESDRALAILAASYLDYLLERLIASVLNIPNKNAENFLFEGPNAGLGSFSSKIEMVYHLGLLNEDEKRDFHLLRKIRNDFAHDFIGVSFETDSVTNRCRELKAAQVGEVLPTAREQYKKASVRLMVHILSKIGLNTKSSPGPNS